MLNNEEINILRDYLDGAVHLDVKINKHFDKETKYAIIEYENGSKRIAVFDGHRFKIANYDKFSSVQEYVSRGIDGISSYRGNCCGKIIEQFINYCRCKIKDNLIIADPMMGGGTSYDVVKRMGLDKNYWGSDLRKGFDVLQDDIPVSPNVIWVHPPYYVAKHKAGKMSNMPIYSGSVWGTSKDINMDDGSHLHDYHDYISWLNQVQEKLYEQLRKNGRLGILLGASKMDGKYYDPVFDMDKLGEIESVVIKKQNNCFSDNISYSNNSFIAIEHEYLLIIKKNGNIIIPCHVVDEYETSIFKLKNITWKNLIVNLVEDLGGKATIDQVHSIVKDIPKSRGNNNVRAKIRQVFSQNKDIFTKLPEGSYCLNTCLS